MCNPPSFFFFDKGNLLDKAGAENKSTITLVQKNQCTMTVKYERKLPIRRA